MDVEKVEVPLPNPTKKHKFRQEVAYISVVNSDKDEIFKAKIKRPKGTFRVTRHTFRINGIKPDSLEGDGCIELDEAIEQLRQVLNGKLVVGLELEKDFDSMGLDIGEFDVFDLQSYYYRLDYSVYGKRIEEKLGLRSLSKYFFGVDMQTGIHICRKDAEYSVKIFLERYCVLMPPPLKIETVTRMVTMKFHTSMDN